MEGFFKFLENLDLAAIGGIFLALLLVFRGVAELLKKLGKLLKQDRLTGIGKSIGKFVERAGEFLENFGIGRDKSK